MSQVPFRIVGVMSKQGTVAFQNQDDQIVIPLAIAQHQILGINYLQFIRVKVDTAAHVKTTITDVQNVLRQEHHIQNASDDDFSVRDLADAIKILTNITNALQLFLALMAGVSLVVGGIGIMNIMLVTVTERTREIGLRKAIGATPKAIRNQFLIEAILLTSVGGILGIGIGSLISYAIAFGARYAGYDWAFLISPTAILLALGVSVATGVTFGLYPAIKASKLDPIVALRYE
jgi:putative ABC transport system permease protein